LITINPVLPQVEVKKLDEAPSSLDIDAQSMKRLDVIRQRGSLRIAYLPERLPFAFQNKDGQLVGFDMELAHALARDLEVTLEVTRLSTDKGAQAIVEALNTGQVDILLGGVGITPPRVLSHPFTKAYLEGNVALVVKDHMRQEFSSLEKIRKMSKIKLAIPHSEYFKEILQQTLPNAEIVMVTSFRDFLRGKMKDVDAFVHLAEAASAWTLIYPDYTVVIPEQLKIKTPIGFVLPEGQDQFKSSINDWLDVQTKNNTIDKIYQHWILGKSGQKKKPRWSIKRDVLGWGVKEDNN